MSDKYLQQEIYIAKSAVLTFIFFVVFVAIPNLVYGVLGTSGSIGNNIFWIFGKLIHFETEKWSHQNTVCKTQSLIGYMRMNATIFVGDDHHLVPFLP